MASIRKVHGRTVLVTGQRNPLGRKMRVCPTCEAKPGHSCGRWIRFVPKYGEGQRWQTLKTFHKDR